MDRVKDKKKILLISPQPFFQWRGSPIRVRFNALALAKAGYDVDLLTLPMGEKVEIKGVRIIRVANLLKLENIPIGPSMPKLFFDGLLLLKGLALLRQQRYALIHGIEEAGVIANLLARMARCPSIFEKHSDPFSYKEGILKNLLLSVYATVEKISVRLADAVIGTGPGLVRQVQAMGTRTRAFHIFDIPSSLVEPNVDRVASLRLQLQQKEHEVLVTFVGSFAVYQGMELLLQAMPEVTATSSKVRFVIIGGTAAEIESRKHWLSQRNADKQVTFLGKIPPDILPDYLAAADILLSPRISGVNTPLKILDYLKAGRAIIATDVEANRLLLDESTAILAPPETTAFAKAIVELAADEKKRAKMGAKGRFLYRQSYNFKEYTRRLANCYQYVLHRRESLFPASMKT